VSRVDVDIRVTAPAAVPFERPSSDVIAERADDKHAYYTFCRVQEGVVARFFGLGEFFLPHSLDRIICHATPDTDPEYLSILLSGSLPAYIHSAQGGTALHASAVALAKGALAIVGPSSQGKTTMAALLCAAGALLVTDDLLVVDLLPEGSVGARRGGTELRIRQEARSIIDRFPVAVPRRCTVDGRVAVRAPMMAAETVPLSAIVVPRPSPDGTAVGARLLGPGEATLLLAMSHRIEGWRQAATLRDQFRAVSEITARIPVVELALPWGPPYDVDLGAKIVRSCNSVTNLAAALEL
jgi:hypothetical protein